MGAGSPRPRRGRRLEEGAGQTRRAGLGGRGGWAGVPETHTVGVTHGLGLRGRAVLHGAGERGGEPAPLLWTWVYLLCELERKSERGRLKPDEAEPTG